MSGPSVLTSFGAHVVTMPEIEFRFPTLHPSCYVVFENGSSINFIDDPEFRARIEGKYEAAATARQEARRAHDEARGPGTRKRKTKVDRYPFKVAAPMGTYTPGVVRLYRRNCRHLTVWCRDNAVGKYRIDNVGVETRRFHFADEGDAILFQVFSGGVAV